MGNVQKNYKTLPAPPKFLTASESLSLKLGNNAKIVKKIENDIISRLCRVESFTVCGYELRRYRLEDEIDLATVKNICQTAFSHRRTIYIRTINGLILWNDKEKIPDSVLNREDFRREIITRRK